MAGVARGRSADAEARLEGCKVREVSLTEAGHRATQDLLARLSRKVRLETAADGETCFILFAVVVSSFRAPVWHVLCHCCYAAVLPDLPGPLAHRSLVS